MIFFHMRSLTGLIPLKTWPGLQATSSCPGTLVKKIRRVRLARGTAGAFAVSLCTIGSLFHSR